MLAAAGPVDLVVAATALPEQLARCRAELEGSGVVFVPALAGPDGADLALLSYATRCPAGEMEVASDDRSFAALAAAGHRIVVLSRRPKLVSKKLKVQAAQIVPFSPPAKPKGRQALAVARRRAQTFQERQGRPARLPLRRPSMSARAERRWWHEALQEWADADMGARPPGRFEGDGVPL